MQGYFSKGIAKNLMKSNSSPDFGLLVVVECDYSLYENNAVLLALQVGVVALHFKTYLTEKCG